MGYVNDGVLGTENAEDAYGAVVYFATEQADRDFSELAGSKVKEPAVLGSVHAITALAAVDRQAVQIHVPRAKIQQWREACQSWYGSQGVRAVPKKWREGTLRSALAEFDKLEDLTWTPKRK